MTTPLTFLRNISRNNTLSTNTASSSRNTLSRKKLDLTIVFRNIPCKMFTLEEAF